MLLPQKSAFFKSVMVILTSSVIAQAISFLVSPALSRIYNPSTFGQLAVFMSVGSLFGVMSTARYELAIMLPSEEVDAAALFLASLFFSVIVSVASYFIILFCKYPIQSITKTSDFDGWVFFIPMFVFFTGISGASSVWLNRKGEYYLIGRIRLYQSVLVAGITLVYGLIEPSATGLILGNVLGLVVPSLFLLLKILHSNWNMFARVTRSRIVEIVVKYKDFPLVNSLQAFLDSSQAFLVTVVISASYGSESLGYYSFSTKMLRTPLAIIGAAIAQVFYQKVTSLWNNGEDIRTPTIYMIRRLALAGLPFIFIVVAIGPWLFKVVFGGNWVVAGVYSQWLSPWIYMNFLASSISQIPIVVGRQRGAFLFSVVGNSSIIIGLFLCAKLDMSIELAFMLVSMLMVIYYIAVLLWIISLCTRRVSNAEADGTN